MNQQYVHLPLGEEVHFLAGYYSPQKELRLPHNGREVLCVIGMSCVESHCCGARSGTYAIVPGFIESWKSRQNESGLPVSDVMPIEDEPTRREVRDTIRKAEFVWNVDFW
jgi:hypothetical protein